MEQLLLFVTDKDFDDVDEYLKFLKEGQPQWKRRARIKESYKNRYYYNYKFKKRKKK